MLSLRQSAASRVTELTGDELERCLFHWGAVIKAAPKGWDRDFALNIQKLSRRRWWKPTHKQSRIMRHMVSELFAGSDGGEAELIEE